MKKKKVISAEVKPALNKKPAKRRQKPFSPADTGGNNNETSNFPIAGIGASAGGLGAFEAFFSAMPPDTPTGMAFVLVQHLDPDHKSILAELIKRHTSMDVYEVEDGMKVRPDCVYIIPPNKDMALLNGVLHLMEPASPRGMRLPIDFFFRSLACDRRERAVCIVLSGTGSDGTHGLRAVKGEGGMAVAQSPDSTEYDGMPKSAIATGLVDYVLPPAQMPGQLIAYAKSALGRLRSAAPAPAAANESAVKKIIILLRSRTGNDFSHYKKNLIIHRVERRMTVNKIETIDEYVQYLQHKPEELEALFRDMLIGVTNFFRDPEAFEVLKLNALADILNGKPDGSTVRIWVAGCSTGEEAYSIAIILHEHLERLKTVYQVQIFATDIDGRAIETARAGIYPAGIAADVSPERLARFFTHNPDNDTFRIKKHIRDMIIFSEQSLIKDPPFSKLDLICCRNFLIYLDAELQKKIISLFHYALNPGGIMFLGNSESVGDSAGHFTSINRKWKLYRRREADANSAPAAKLFTQVSDRDYIARYHEKSGAAKPTIRELTEQELLRQFAPPCVVVNGRGDILYINGRTGKYLEPAPGDAGNNVLQMAREGMRCELTIALHKAEAGKKPIIYKNLQVKTNGGFTGVNLTVRPMAPRAGESEQALFMIIFEDACADDKKRTTEPAAGSETPGGGTARISELENQLQAKEEYLQSTLEEMQAANEELKSVNEELQSVNEELQSTNEELETSKEELQSMNEELSTVNAELQQKVGDLSRTNNDMNNLLAGTNIGTLFLDHQLRIQRFTPAVRRIINLISTDTGRPVSDIAYRIKGYDGLVSDARSVLDTLVPREAEVQIPDGQWYHMRIQPYRTLENVIEGAVITFVEITEMKRLQEEIRETGQLRRLAGIVCDLNYAVTVCDLKGRIMAWNPAAVKLYGWSETEALAMNIGDMIPPGSRKAYMSMIKKTGRGEITPPYNAMRAANDGGIIDIWLTACPLINDSGEIYAVATIERER